MAYSLMQLTLAVAPAVIISMLIRRANFPWEKEKRPSERAELLTMFAKDVKRVKLIMARNISAVKEGRACTIPSLGLANWRRLKSDERLKKYSDEKIFKEMISQFRQWEQMKTI